MPKIGKEKREEVINFLKQGYTIKETVEKTGTSRNYVGKIKKELKQKEKSTVEPKGGSLISNESIQTLYNIQGLYGISSLDETIKQLEKDVRVIMPIKYEFDHDYTTTIGDVFKTIYDRYKGIKIITDDIFSAKNDDTTQRVVLDLWKVDPAVFAFHDISYGAGFEGTITDMMSNAVLHSYTSLGWQIKYYFNETLGKKMPILITPNGKELKIPVEET